MITFQIVECPGVGVCGVDVDSIFAVLRLGEFPNHINLAGILICQEVECPPTVGSVLRLRDGHVSVLKVIHPGLQAGVSEQSQYHEE